MVTSTAPNTVYFRTISCPCLACISGELENCTHQPFVPNWDSKQIQFTPLIQGISLARNCRDVQQKIMRVAMQQEHLPWFCCLGWIERLQQPAVLLMTSSQLELSDTTVKCHVLKPWNPPVNEFCWTVVERPATVCPRSATRCQCNQLHWKDFQLANILEVAVKKGRGNLFKNLFCKFTPDSPYPLSLIHMSQSKESVQCFQRYSDKRLRYHNDFFLVESTENL